jgi:hypothetical protein
MPTRQRIMFLLALGLFQACRGEDRQAPNPGDLVIAKTETLSGAQQVGAAGATLVQALRVVVMREDMPVETVPVIWSTPEGSVTPASATRCRRHQHGHVDAETPLRSTGGVRRNWHERSPGS